MSGEGHKDRVSGIHFQPKGSHLVTSSGDCTIKVWDLLMHLVIILLKIIYSQYKVLNLIILVIL